MRSSVVLYIFLLALTGLLPWGVMGIAAHYQSYSVHYWGKFQIPFSYIIGVSVVTILGWLAHVAGLILELEASASGFEFRKNVEALWPVIVTLLIPFWIAVPLIFGLKDRLGLIGACISTPPPGHVVELIPRLCTEWKISLGLSSAMPVALIIFWLNLSVGGRNAFVAEVWRVRQRAADRKKGIVLPPRIAPPAATLLPTVAPIPATTAPAPAPTTAAGPPPPPAASLTIPPMAAAGGAVTIQPSTSVSPGSHPSVDADVEANAGLAAEHEASSDPLTSPASPPPSSHPSWLQSSNTRA